MPPITITSGDTLLIRIGARVRAFSIDRESWHQEIQAIPPRTLVLIDDQSAVELEMVREYFFRHPLRAARYRTWLNQRRKPLTLDDQP